MGGSGCGKSTVLRALMGTLAPAEGHVWLEDHNLWAIDETARQQLLRHCDVVLQSGGSWSSITLAENVALPLGEYTDLTASEIEEVSPLKLALVGLASFEDYYADFVESAKSGCAQIPTIPSRMAQIENSAAATLGGAGVVLAALNDLLSIDNQQQLTEILENTKPLRPCARVSRLSSETMRRERSAKMTKTKDKKTKHGGDGQAEGSLPKMKRKEFEAELYKLQVELTRLQAWAVTEGARIIVVFEGRDTAGKGGVISRITARTSPRVYKHVALPKPSDREKTQMYAQRYLAHFPAGGEIILFDRSWYNRAGVERVMGFCSEQQYERFMRVVPNFEREVVDDGIILLKYFLDVSQEEQRRRFEARINDPLKHWKLSPMDTESVRRWWDYTKAYQEMIERTDSAHAPWYLVPADDKRRARLNLISHLLEQIPYKKVKMDLPKVPKAEPRPDGLRDDLPVNHIVPYRF